MSDVDMLVEFEPDHIPGYITLAGMEIELTNLIGRKVDLRTPGEISHYFRQQVVDTAQLIYVAHAYFGVQLDIVWSTVIQDLPPLIEELETIIGREEQD